MEIHNIDNSSSQEIERTITWQFDQATRLVGLIHMVKNCAEETTEKFWDKYKDNLCLFLDDTTPTSADDFALAVWGNLLNVPRPTIGTGDDAAYISAPLYKKILKATYDLRNSHYSLADINAYLHAIGLDEIGYDVLASGVMELSYSSLTVGEDDSEVKQLALTGYFKQLPAAVDDNAWSPQTVFGFSGQVESAGKKYVEVWFNGIAGTSIPSLVDGGSNIAPLAGESDTAINADGIGHAIYVVSGNYAIGDINTSSLSTATGISFAVNYNPSRAFPAIGALCEDDANTGSVFASKYTL